MLQQVIPHFSLLNYDFLKIWQYVTFVSVVIERGQNVKVFEAHKKNKSLNRVYFPCT